MTPEEKIHLFLEENSLEMDVKKINSYQFRLLGDMGEKLYDIFPKSGKFFDFSTHKYTNYMTLSNALKSLIKSNSAQQILNIEDCISFLKEKGYMVIKKENLL